MLHRAGRRLLRGALAAPRGAAADADAADAARARLARLLSGAPEDEGGAPRVIRIDRSGLFGLEPPPATSGGAAAAAGTSSLSPLARHLRALIHLRGPLTLAEYMSQCLTSPVGGYYTRDRSGAGGGGAGGGKTPGAAAADVFGARGDFTTSPEVSQLFGEMVGAWAAATWAALGRPRALRLVELGPGRGTLMADVLRATAGFAGFRAALREVFMVEVSPPLRAAQQAALGFEPDPGGDAGDAASVDGRIAAGGGCRAGWRPALADVPGGEPGAPPAIFIAHEFFDALPVHQFRRAAPGGAWREVLVDVARPAAGGGGGGAGAGGGGRAAGRAPSGAPAPPFRLVLSPSATPAARALLPRRLAALPPAARAALTAVEVSPAGMAAAGALAARLRAAGGAALVVDYGRDAPYEASLSAIRGHAAAPLLAAPGDADLSAWVDFSALRAAVLRSSAARRAPARRAGGSGAGGAAAAEGRAGAPPPAVTVHGPIPQAEFLLRCGIAERAEALAAAGAAGVDALNAQLERLVGGGDAGMGRTYQAFCIAALPGGAAPPVFAEAEAAAARAAGESAAREGGGPS